MMHSTAGAAFWSVTVLVLWLLVMGGSAWAAVRLIRRPRRQLPPSLPSPLEILERRFAAGEITRDDFDEARARLREHNLDL
ncbi:SHOCT domain-containing protein [Kribbella sp. CA-245084]|uniref:SHOCT domain-containing protein n=1 Tax=Kribbella sp. CA-245084 TaxID=3239940 RepID=UPI003D8D9C90